MIWSQERIFLEKSKDHLKGFPNLSVFGLVFLFGERRLVTDRVFKGKQIEKIVRQRCRKSPFQKVKKTAYCSLYILLVFLHFHWNQLRSIPFEKEQVNYTLLSEKWHCNSCVFSMKRNGVENFQILFIVFRNWGNWCSLLKKRRRKVIICLKITVFGFAS